MAKAKHTKKKNQHHPARQFSARELRDAIGSSQGRVDKVAARIFAATKKGHYLTIEVIDWLNQNSRDLLKEASEEIRKWLAGFVIESART